MKKYFTAMMAVILCISILSGTALADSDKKSRLVLGNDLTQTQQDDMVNYFDVQEDAVVILRITIDEEKALLSSLVPEEKIGSKSISSIYIEQKDDGAGLTVTTKNINWVTSDMYIAALTTAGIKDANIKIAAPFKVSGTAALAGIYKAYEDITGQTLSPEAKDIASEELILTGNLADFIGSEEATILVGELKTALEEIKGKSYDEVKAMVLEVAKENDVELTDEQLDQLVNLLMRLADMNIDPQQLLEQARQYQDLANKLNNLKVKAEGVGGWITKVWTGFVSWLKNIFR